MLNIIHNALYQRTKSKKVHGRGTHSANKKGFSLIEIVVVIAIMAILAALLVPVLLRYTENSRAQKDVTAMDEVVNAVQLALADPDCFDEMELYSCDNNYITYTDSSGKYGQQIIDAEYWAPDGYGRATTITFNPEKDSQGNTIYRLENAIVNDMTYGNGSIADNRTMEGTQIGNNQCFLPNAKLSEGQESGYLYNRVRQTIGTNVITTSATYANSSFTIFIKFNQKDGVTVADVNGSFNGTNLYSGAQSAVGSGTNTEIVNPDTGDKEQGEATQNGGYDKNNYTGSSLQGTGVTIGGGAYKPVEDYKQPTYVENLQKEHKFEYYSTLVAAVNDVNNNSIGENADCDKADAVAGIYEQDGAITVVLLKDHQTMETVSPSVDMTILLGGRKLYFSTNEKKAAIQQEAGTLIVDARITGSGIHVDGQGTDAKISAINVKSGSHCTIYGGEYYSENKGGGTTGGLIAQGNSQFYVYNAKVIVKSSNTSTVIAVQSSTTNTTLIDNCDIECYRTDKQTMSTSANQIGILARGLTTVQNCNIQTYGPSYDGDGIYTGALGIGALAGDDTITMNVKVRNCDVFGTTWALHTQFANGVVVIDGGTYTSENAAITVKNNNDDTTTVKIKNTILKKIENTDQYAGKLYYRASLIVWTANCYLDNVQMQSNEMAVFFYKDVFISNSKILSGTIELWNKCKLYSGQGNNFEQIPITGNGKLVSTDKVY